jgi:hypothetical protein
VVCTRARTKRQVGVGVDAKEAVHFDHLPFGERSETAFEPAAEHRRGGDAHRLAENASDAQERQHFRHRPDDRAADADRPRGCGWRRPGDVDRSALDLDYHAEAQRAAIGRGIRVVVVLECCRGVVEPYAADDYRPETADRTRDERAGAAFADTAATAAGDEHRDHHAERGAPWTHPPSRQQLLHVRSS